MIKKGDLLILTELATAERIHVATDKAVLIKPVNHKGMWNNGEAEDVWIPISILDICITEPCVNGLGEAATKHKARPLPIWFAKKLRKF